MFTMSEPPSGESSLIQADEIKTVLTTSGYLLEGRIASVLQGITAHVDLNRFLADPRDEGKSIEIDVWGHFPECIDKKNNSVVAAETLIECKNNSQPVVFFLKPQFDRGTNENRIKYRGFPQSSADPGTQRHIPLHQLLAMKGWHHYCQVPEVATQFCSFARDQAAEEQQKQQHGGRKVPLPRAEWCWKSECMEHYSRSFSNLCIATEWTGDGLVDITQPNIQLQFCYPVIVFQGPFYEARVTDGGVEVCRSDHLQFHHSASVGGRVVRVQIDVVSESAFPALIEGILKELQYIASGIRKHEERLLASAIDQKRVARQRRAVA